MSTGTHYSCICCVREWESLNRTSDPSGKIRKSCGRRRNTTEGGEGSEDKRAHVFLHRFHSNTFCLYRVYLSLPVHLRSWSIVFLFIFLHTFYHSKESNPWCINFIVKIPFLPSALLTCR